MIRIIRENIDFDNDFDYLDFGEDKWIVKVPKECIKGATLLSEEEYEEYGDNISNIDDLWWLRSAGTDEKFACGVMRDGNVKNNCYVDHDFFCVRPSLTLKCRSSNYNTKVGDKFEFGGHLFTIISKKLAICDDSIGESCFREDYRKEDANVYEESDVKKVIDDWFNKSYAEYEG